MAWGKAIPAWHGAVLDTSATPATPATRLQAALDLLIHLNDTYALDGGAPPSFAGVLWCLGWRDRPGPGGCPKSRPTSILARRFKAGDLERLARSRCAAADALSRLTGGRAATSAPARGVVGSGAAPTPCSATTPAAPPAVSKSVIDLSQSDDEQAPQSAAVAVAGPDDCIFLGTSPAKASAAAATEAAPPPETAPPPSTAPPPPLTAPPSTPRDDRPRGGDRPAKRQGTLWHFLNKQSADELANL